MKIHNILDQFAVRFLACLAGHRRFELVGSPHRLFHVVLPVEGRSITL
jgi:hypothetical protein